MPNETDVADARVGAQIALFKKIEDAVSNANTFDRIERLARAYRYVAGGSQPGAVESAPSK